MKIRKASQKDIPKIVEIELNSNYNWTETEEKEIKNVKALFSEGNIFLLVTQNEIDFAYICYRIVKDIFKLNIISIRKEFQGKGLGRQLMNYLIGLAKKNKCNQFVLEVWEKNLSALGLYKGLEFVVTNIKKKHYPNGDNKLVMKLEF